MRIVIIGAVAAGTSAAAKARRNSETAEIVLYEKGSQISYSSCGMPYAIGGIVEDPVSLSPRNPAFFKAKYNVEVRVRHEVLSIHPDRQTLDVRDLGTGQIMTDTYDKLILATGASAMIPPIPGAELPHVFTLRTLQDMGRIQAFISHQRPRTAVIIGSGFIGLEMCENLKRLGMDVTILEKLAQVTPWLDADMAIHVEDHLRRKGVTVHTGVSVSEIAGSSVLLADGQTIPAQMVLLATGVRPETTLARNAGIQLGITNAIRVNTKQETNISGIYACGDCAEQYHLITGQPVYRPLGSTANKTGRIAGDQATGGNLEFRGILGTGIFRVFDLTVAQTGLTQFEATKAGYDAVVCHNIKPDRPEYLGGQEMVIKAVADRTGGRLLGAQIVGYGGVDKRIDVLATAITFKARAADLFHLDLAYAPPFSTTKDPVMYTGMILENAIHRGRPLIEGDELDSLMRSGEPYTLIDVREADQYARETIPGAQSIPLATLRSAIPTLDPEGPTVTFCNKGVTGNAAQNILLNNGFKRVYNLSGGQKQYRKTHAAIGNRKPEKPV